MDDRKEALRSLMCRLSFPPDAQKTFLNAFACIAADRVGSAWFLSLLQQYEKSEQCQYTQLLSDMKVLGESLGIHEYTSAMLLFLCMGEKLLDRYTERGIDESIYYHTMMDFRYKLNECRQIYGMDGLFTAFWSPGFFDLSRFALGRLQFEIVKTKADCTVDGETFPAGSKAINMHIPRTDTKLDHEAVLESYGLAAEMFAHEFDARPVLFTCYSWLIAPWHLNVLSPESNLFKFIKDFKLVESGAYTDYSSAWRIFDCQFSGDVSALPQTTSLQRAYAERITRGEPIEWGRGFFVYRDGKVCNR